MTGGIARFVLHTTEAPKPSRKRTPPPALTVERCVGRASTDEPASAVADTPDDHWGEIIARRRAEFVASEDARLERGVQTIAGCMNEDVRRAEQCARFRPRATREEWLAREREGWARMGREAIERLERDHATAVTARHTLKTDAEPETRSPGVYLAATTGLGLSLTLVEAEGVTARVQVGGDAALQARILDFLVDLGSERETMRAVRE